ncbi:MAG: glycosyltransferase family 1 protein [Rhodospirillales bacterium]|nr:glycosyltransferase family 1 protein [Rhodospirillales bacterium]
MGGNATRERDVEHSAGPFRILIVSDAWFPQVNGVVRTLEALRRQLVADGHAVVMVTPDGFRSIPCPSYPEIRLALPAPAAVARLIEAFHPHAIHIATEGPLGLVARWCCRRRGVPFTTSYHTHFPEYVAARWRLPSEWTYRFFRWFHAPSDGVMVSTQSLEQLLHDRGFQRLRRWSRGVDTAMFRPREKTFYPHPRPVSLYVGRIAIEKGIEDFLRLDLPGTKVVVGDGPLLPELRRRYPQAIFAGGRAGEELARHYAAADVFVFPSRTDTFGLVLLEALASGVPVAAYPVPGPLDVIGGSGAGSLDEDLGAAVLRALRIPPEACRQHALSFSWQHSARQFLFNLQLIG